jgi:uncharacterized cupin superfamily protein
MEAVTHWDDLAAEHHELGPMNARWRTAGGVRLGMSRIDVLPGAQSTPAHQHTAEEELFFVLRGDGLWWQDGRTTAVGEGDVMFAKPRGGAHTVIGGNEGIDVLAFGPRLDIELVHLPRPGVVRIGGVATVTAHSMHQWMFEAEMGPVERVEPDPTHPRPANVVHLTDVPTAEEDRPGWEQVERGIGRHLGARTTGMTLMEIAPAAKSFPFHCHSAEEELFVVLDGAGTLRLGDDRHALRPGHIVSRPAGTRIAHQFIAGDGGLTVLAYSNIDPNDLAFFPDSNKVKLRGLNVMMRVEPVDYWDGED